MKHLKGKIQGNKDDLIAKINQLIKESDLGDEIQVSSVTLKPAAACRPPCYLRNVQKLVNGKWVIVTECKCPRGH